MSRDQKVIERKTYETFKDIRNRIATGQTTTFAERNWVTIVLKKQDEKSLRKALLNA